MSKTEQPPAGDFTKEIRNWYGKNLSSPEEMVKYQRGLARSWIKSMNELREACDIIDKFLEKPFEECYKGNCAMGIRIEGEHIEIYSCTGTTCNKEDDFCNFNIVSAERFHNALGYAIAELKQK